MAASKFPTQLPFQNPSEKEITCDLQPNSYMLNLKLPHGGAMLPLMHWAALETTACVGLVLKFWTGNEVPFYMPVYSH